jgi:hypothetical protein
LDNLQLLFRRAESGTWERRSGHLPHSFSDALLIPKSPPPIIKPANPSRGWDACKRSCPVQDRHRRECRHNLRRCSPPVTRATRAIHETFYRKCLQFPPSHAAGCHGLDSNPRIAIFSLSTQHSLSTSSFGDPESLMTNSSRAIRPITVGTMDMNSEKAEEDSVTPSLADNHHAPPVQSLEETLTEAFGWPTVVRNRPERAIGHHDTLEARPNLSADFLASLYPKSTTQLSTSPSQPVTPLNQPSSNASCFNGAISSSPKSLSLGSLRLSDSDSHLTAEESVGDDHSRAQMATGHRGGSELELVMPSLTLPNRRPFTERGKRMGQLTVCVAGGRGMFLSLLCSNH